MKRTTWFCRLCVDYHVIDRTKHLVQNHNAKRNAKGGNRWQSLLNDIFRESIKQ
jgi:hypothetical protein